MTLIRPILRLPQTRCVNEPDNRRLKTRFHAERNLRQTRPKSIVVHTKLQRVPTALDIDDMRVNTEAILRWFRRLPKRLMTTITQTLISTPYELMKQFVKRSIFDTCVDRSRRQTTCRKPWTAAAPITVEHDINLERKKLPHQKPTAVSHNDDVECRKQLNV